MNYITVAKFCYKSYVERLVSLFGDETLTDGLKVSYEAAKELSEM